MCKKLFMLTIVSSLLEGAGFSAVKSYLSMISAADSAESPSAAGRFVGSPGIDYGDIRRASAQMAFH
jgi:hypothetical protein